MTEKEFNLIQEVINERLKMDDIGQQLGWLHCITVMN